MKKYERIRNLREDSDLTQMELGQLLHISQRAYSHYEAGTRDISIGVLIGLADIYKVNVDYLLHRTDVKEMLPVSDIKQ